MGVTGTGSGAQVLLCTSSGADGGLPACWKQHVCSDPSIAAGCGDHAIAVWVRVKSGLGVLGGSVTPGARAELQKGSLRALSPSVLLLGPHGRLPLLEQCLTLPWLMVQFGSWKSHRGFVAWALQGIPVSCQLQGSQSQSNKGLDTTCIPRYHIGRQLFCLNSVLWALEAAWGCWVTGLDDDVIH